MLMANKTLGRRGFTIVELIVVVTIIAILVTITIIAYNGVQAKGRDNLRKNDVATLAKLITIYASQNGTWSPTNCGDTSNTLNGYVNSVYGANNTIMTCLKNYDSTTKQISDPSGCVTLTDNGASCKQSIRGAYVAYNTIATNSHYYLVAKLETLGADQSSITNSDMDATTQNTVKTAGFNYLLKVR